MTILKRFVKDTEGQDLVEYGLLIGLITLGVVAALQLLGPGIQGYYDTLNTTLGFGG